MQQRLTELFETCDIQTVTSEKFCPENIFPHLNCDTYYITLHNIEKLKPVYINDLLKMYYGFDKNTFSDIDYFYYFMTVHPSKYSSLLDSVMHFKKGGEGFLDLEYKLKNAKNKFEKFIGSTKTIFLDEKPLYAITVMQKTDNFNQDDGDRSKSLSPREREIINIYCQGKNVKEVAEILYISQNTVKVHLKNIYKKLGVSNGRELISFFDELKV